MGEGVLSCEAISPPGVVALAKVVLAVALVGLGGEIKCAGGLM